MGKEPTSQIVYRTYKSTSILIKILQSCLVLIASQHHTIQYPTLSRMAHDYLAIQGSVTRSERAFSSGVPL